jgi:Domain of unknown function (DUF1844)
VGVDLGKVLRQNIGNGEGLAMAEEREFEVIDKRRVKAEGAGGGETGSEPAEEPSAAEPGGSGTASEQGGSDEGRGITEEELRAAMEEAAAVSGGEMPELSVPGALRFCIETLQGLAWIKMGLVATPGSGKIEKDLLQAKIAIDATGDLVTRLHPLISEGEQRELQTVLSNLRINFVQKSQQG